MSESTVETSLIEWLTKVRLRVLVSLVLILTALMGSALVTGCARPDQEVRLRAGCGGSPLQMSWSGDITYTDQNGQPVTLKNSALPWNVKFLAKSGQTINLSFQGIAPFATYRIAIECGSQADDSEVITAQSGPGGQELTCTFTVP
jgi:hypothetical protein